MVSPAPGVEDVAMDSRDDNPHQPGGTLVFGLQF